MCFLRNFSGPFGMNREWLRPCTSPTATCGRRWICCSARGWRTERSPATRCTVARDVRWRMRLRKPSRPWWISHWVRPSRRLMSCALWRATRSRTCWRIFTIIWRIVSAHFAGSFCFPNLFFHFDDILCFPYSGSTGTRPDLSFGKAGWHWVRRSESFFHLPASDFSAIDVAVFYYPFISIRFSKKKTANV